MRWLMENGNTLEGASSGTKAGDTHIVFHDNWFRPHLGLIDSLRASPTPLFEDNNIEDEVIQAVAFLYYNDKLNRNYRKGQRKFKTFDCACPTCNFSLRFVEHLPACSSKHFVFDYQGSVVEHNGHGDWGEFHLISKNSEFFVKCKSDPAVGRALSHLLRRLLLESPVIGMVPSSELKQWMEMKQEQLINVLMEAHRNSRRLRAWAFLDISKSTLTRLKKENWLPKFLERRQRLDAAGVSSCNAGIPTCALEVERHVVPDVAVSSSAVGAMVVATDDDADGRNATPDTPASSSTIVAAASPPPPPPPPANAPSEVVDLCTPTKAKEATLTIQEWLVVDSGEDKELLQKMKQNTVAESPTDDARVWKNFRNCGNGHDALRNDGFLTLFQAFKFAGWYKSSVITSFVALLNQRAASIPGGTKWLGFDDPLAIKLMNSTEELRMCEKMVRKKMRAFNVGDIFALVSIIVVHNETGSIYHSNERRGEHWRFVEIRPQEKTITLYDSMGKVGAYQQLLSRIKQLLKHLWNNTQTQRERGDWIDHEWMVHETPPPPITYPSQEHNGTECGVFTCLGMLSTQLHTAERGKSTFQFGLRDMVRARDRIALCFAHEFILAQTEVRTRTLTNATQEVENDDDDDDDDSDIEEVDSDVSGSSPGERETHRFLSFVNSQPTTVEEPATTRTFPETFLSDYFGFSRQLASKLKVGEIPMYFYTQALKLVDEATTSQEHGTGKVTIAYPDTLPLSIVSRYGEKNQMVDLAQTLLRLLKRRDEGSLHEDLVWNCQDLVDETFNCKSAQCHRCHEVFRDKRSLVCKKQVEYLPAVDNKPQLGLFATTELKKGTYLLPYEGAAKKKKDINLTTARYAMDKGAGWVIDASDCPNALARYANHSCCPNCEYVKVQCPPSSRTGTGKRKRTGGKAETPLAVGDNYDVHIMTTQDIAAGEEITVKYGTENFHLEQQQCRCILCRGRKITD
jgi:hypothetical protein